MHSCLSACLPFLQSSKLILWLYSETGKMKKLRLIPLLFSMFMVYEAQAQEVLFKGEFERESRWTTFEGTWSIVKEGEQFKVVLGNDFEAKKAPDLKIFLSKAQLGDISGKNAVSIGEPVLVAKLESYKGSATYSIPEGIIPSDFKTIILHCEEYSKLWGGAPLARVKD